jgi:putative NIF3 family GTP cyclohydrolase 1 type 2
VIAVGAGSGSKLLNNCKADLIITGEFDHHEILHETHRGVSLIVTDHSNTERLYYKYFRESFSQLLKKYNESVEILISEQDRDPLEYV